MNTLYSELYLLGRLIVIDVFLVYKIYIYDDCKSVICKCILYIYLLFSYNMYVAVVATR